ncbi:MAG: tryptophan--tRNA ligase [Pseudomonadota bacterium]
MSNTMRRVLTGITTTGVPHLGNYVGAIKPAIAASRREDVQSYYFLADYHAIIKNQSPEEIHQSAREIACTWLALGLDTDNATFYRQSDIPEVLELSWILTCMTAKGLMNRAHAYKAAVAQNDDSGEDTDHAITMGLFSYPVLMSADILMFNAHDIPVGRDQIQHVEMARDIAARFNHVYGELFTLPQAVVDDNTAILQGLDGRKMSKSYNNTIPLFLPEKKLLKSIRKIKTNLLEPGEPKDPDDSALFQIWQAFASPEQTQYMRREFENGIAWGEAKNQLFELINAELSDARGQYETLMADANHVETVLRAGAEKARDYSAAFLSDVRKAIGIRSLSD